MAAIADGWETGRGEAKAEAQIVPPFLGRKGCPTEGARNCCKPGPSGGGAFQTALVRHGEWGFDGIKDRLVSGGCLGPGFRVTCRNGFTVSW